MSGRPRVVVLSTGGTIASRVDRTRDVVVSTDTGDELLARLGALAPDVEVAAEQFCNLGSFRMDLETAYALARRAATILADAAVAGVVVTHGTDTMEESAYLVDLISASDKPIVFTGAQRHADEPDGDGPRNLADAIRVAAAPQARGLGTLILFEQEFHAARDATKTHASRVGTFASAEHGKLGEVDAGRVIVQRHPAQRRHFTTDRVETRVDLVKLVMGADDRFVRCAMQGGARGIVLEAFGRGNATPAVAAAVRDAVAQGIVVVVTSRCPQGRVMPIYGDGGGKDLAAAGAVFAGDLSGIKARILLSVLLAAPEAGNVRGAIASVAG
jgi:L-asparaginase